MRSKMELAATSEITIARTLCHYAQNWPADSGVDAESSFLSMRGSNERPRMGNDEISSSLMPKARDPTVRRPCRKIDGIERLG
jgi:hypothetical protein